MIYTGIYIIWIYNQRFYYLEKSKPLIHCAGINHNMMESIFQIYRIVMFTTWQRISKIKGLFCCRTHTHALRDVICHTPHVLNQTQSADMRPWSKYTQNYDMNPQISRRRSCKQIQLGTAICEAPYEQSTHIHSSHIGSQTRFHHLYSKSDAFY